MTEVPSDFLPTKQVKLWKTKDNTKVSKDWSPRTPAFCPVVKPERGDKCGNFMRNWDIMFYEKYGMGEECYLQYNSHVDGVKEKVGNEVGEVTSTKEE